MGYQALISLLVVAVLIFSYKDGEASRRHNVHLREKRITPFGWWVFLAIVTQFLLFRLWQGDFLFFFPILAANLSFYVISLWIGKGMLRDAAVLAVIMLVAVVLALLVGVSSMYQARTFAEYPELQMTWGEVVRQALLASIVTPIAAIFMPRVL